MKKSTKKGFTLVELVIVIAVIAILSAILIPTFGNVISNANETKYSSGAEIGYKELVANYSIKHPEIDSFDKIVIYYDNGVGAGTTATRAYKFENGKLTLLEKTENAGATYSGVNIAVDSKNVPTLTSAAGVSIKGFNDENADSTPVVAGDLYKVNDNVAVLFYEA